MEATGRVLRANVDERWTEVAISRPGCGGCRQLGSCSSAISPDEVAPQVVRLPLLDGAVDGQLVAIHAPEGSVGKLALLAYGLPLLLAVFFSLGAEFMVRASAPDSLANGRPGDWLVPLASVLGLAIGFFMVSRMKIMHPGHLNNFVTTCHTSDAR